MKPYVNQETCIGCGHCVQVCPEVFYLDDNGKSAVRELPDYDPLETKINTAIAECPVTAITALDHDQTATS